MSKLTDPKRKPQQKKPTKLELLEYALKHGFMVWVPNGTGSPIQALIQSLGLKRSTIKLMKGGYDVVETSRIETEYPE